MKTTSSPGISALAREAAMDLGHLLGQHVRVAQIEMKVELHAMGRRASLIAVLATLIALGYGMTLAGVALALGGYAALGLPFVIIGLIHVAGAAVGLMFSPLRPRGSHLMDSSTTAMNSSFAALEKATVAAGPCHPENAHAR
jgi:fatty acid desaturase